MNHAELVEKVAAANAVGKTEAKTLVESVFGAITDAALAGDEISINAFGKFKIKDSPAREGRNPGTGETIQIAASKKLGFAPAKALKEKLNG